MQSLIIQIRDKVAVGAKHLESNRHALEKLQLLSVEAMEMESHNEVLRRRVKDLECGLDMANQIIEMHEGVAHS